MYYNIPTYDGLTSYEWGVWVTNIDSVDIQVSKKTGSSFDNTNFNIMGNDGNRGWVTITYKA